MKVLMFGWEFPPHISGGLGTACYGLTKGLAGFSDLNVIFVVPKAYGDEDKVGVELIGANEVPVTRKEIKFVDVETKVDFYEVESGMVPYIDPEEFWKLTTKVTSEKTRIVETSSDGTINFSGKYGHDLLHEIYNYSIVAGVIARDNEFDVIQIGRASCWGRV